MTESAGAIARTAAGIRRDVKDDVVGMRGIAREQTRRSWNRGHPSGSGHMIQAQNVSYAPADVVIRARGIATHSDTSNDPMPCGIERQPAAKYVHPTNLAPHHRVRCRAVARRRPAVSHASINRVTVL